jgi:zona occludens toxin
MINLLLGAPGGGKSYEAVAYHVIPALAEGRKVITNLPLNLEEFPPEQRRLLDVRTKTRKPAPVIDWKKAESMFKRFGFATREPKFNANSFSNVEDYGIPTPNPETGLIQFIDPWRHPETGAGALYVIDECHKALPRLGTPLAVEEWFAEHRHGFCDVLLMTQSHGKINAAIKDLVQVCYRVRKASHLGFSNRYIRKVLDGVGGTEMNESVREYEPAFFKFYRSHTQSSQAGKELEAKDIVPIWKHWTFKGAALMCIIAIVIFSYTGAWNPMKTNVPAKASASSSKPAAAGPATMQARAGTSTPDASSPVVSEATHEVVTVEKSGSKHPLAGYGLHISGVVHNARKTLYMFTVSQNGQAVYNLNQIDLVSAGYEVKPLNDCIVQVTFGESQFHATCDAPRVSVTPAVTMKS